MKWFRKFLTTVLALLIYSVAILHFHENPNLSIPFSHYDVSFKSLSVDPGFVSFSNQSTLSLSSQGSANPEKNVNPFAATLSIHNLWYATIIHTTSHFLYVSLRKSVEKEILFPFHSHW